MKKSYLFYLVTPVLLSFHLMGQSFPGLTERDPSAVTITCPNDTVVDNDSGECGAWVDVTPATATGSEPIDSIWNNITGQSSAYAWYPVGSTVITWYAVDILGAMDSCTMTVTVWDVAPPTISCPDTTIDCPDNYFPPESTTIPAWDNCDPDQVVDFVSESYEGLGVYPGWCPTAIHRIYRATDNSGNSSTCEQTITVADMCDCATCQDTVPHFIIDLSGGCDDEFVVEDIGRDGFCCDASWPDRCISFTVLIGEGSVGVYIEIIEGAVPGGWWWQVDCGESVRWDEVIYMDPNTYHTITMCEPGTNENTYVIRAVCASAVADRRTMPIDVSISPNPAFSHLSVRYSIEESGEFTFSLMDLFGRQRKAFDLGWVDPGQHEFTLEISDLPVGIYYFSLKENGQRQTANGKLVVGR